MSAPKITSACSSIVAKEIAKTLIASLEGKIDETDFKIEMERRGVKTDADKVEHSGIILRESEGNGDHWTDNVKSYTVITKYAPEKRSYVYHLINPDGTEDWYVYNFSIYL